MGFFDYFKRKPDLEPAASPKPSLVPLLPGPFFVLYREYLRIFLTNHRSGNFAPLAAYQDESGDLHGVYFYSANPDLCISVTDAIYRTTQILASGVAKQTIRSYVLFYHADSETPEGTHDSRISDSDANAVALRFWQISFQGPRTAYVRYSREGDRYRYLPLAGLNESENQELFQAPLRPGHNYFDRSVELSRYEEPTPSGAKLVRGLRGRAELVIGGIFGFRALEDGTFEVPYQQLSGEIIQGEPIQANGASWVSRRFFGDLSMEAIIFKGVRQLIVPISPKTQILEMRVESVIEWEGANGTVGSVVGQFNDQFMLAFVDIDYLRGKPSCLEKKLIEVELWGLSLRIAKKLSPESPDQTDPLFTEDYVGMTPQEQWEYGAFDFTGRVDAIGNILHDSSLLPKMRLLEICVIPAVEGKPAFTVQTIVSKETIQGEELTLGDMVVGTILFFGRVATGFLEGSP